MHKILRKFRVIRFDPPVFVLFCILLLGTALAIPAFAREEPEKTVCFTFDDGPSAVTEEILEILEKENVPATFFVIGPNGEHTDERLRAIVDAGQEIGLHSWSHDYGKIYASADAYLEDLEAEREWIEAVTGLSPTSVRLPGGSTNVYANREVLSAIQNVLKERGLVRYDWNADGKDSIIKGITAREIERNVLSCAEGKNTVVVLLHDSSVRKTTPKALSLLIEDFRKQGYRFCRLSELSEPVCF